MSPTRKVLLGIGVLVLVMLGSLCLAWQHQEHALGEALVADVEATITRTIERAPRLEAAKHANGYACLSKMVEVTPGDLRLFKTSSDEFKTMMDAGVIPDALRPTVSSLEPWAQSVRDCGDSTRLKFVGSVVPFVPFDDAKSNRAVEVLLALSRLTRLQVRLLEKDGQWQSILELCLGTLEVSLDRSHVDLLGAMVAASTVKQLTPPCARALLRAPAESKAQVGKRFSALRTRPASNREIVETERQRLSLMTHWFAMTDEQRAKLPLIDQADGDVFDRFFRARLWPQWDRAMRHLADSADEPGSVRKEASSTLEAVGHVWWAPRANVAEADYEKFLRRMDETAVLLKLLSELALGREVTVSSQLVRATDGWEFTDSQGEKMLIP